MCLGQTVHIVDKNKICLKIGELLLSIITEIHVPSV